MSDIKVTGWLDGRGGNAKREERWLTPKPLVDALGHFDLDPCGAPGHSLADTTYLLEEGYDGVKQPWLGRVWLNPPYGRAAEPFLKRMVFHGNGTALIVASTETRVFEEYVWSKATAILFVHTRITFLRADGEAAKTNGGKGSALVAYGEADAVALRRSGIRGRFIRTASTWALAA